MSDTDPRLDEMNQEVAGLFYSGRYDEGVPRGKEAVRHARTLGDRHQGLADALNNLGNVYLGRGDLPRATPLLEEALDIRKDLLGDRDPSVAQALNNLGALQRSLGNLAEAKGLYEQAVEIWRETNDLNLQTGLENLAEVESKLGDLTASVLHGREAESQLDSLRQPISHEDAMRQFHEGPVVEDPRQADVLIRQAEMYERVGDLWRAMFYFHRAYEIREDALGKAHPEVAGALVGLGRVLLRRGVLDAAEERFEQALEILRSSGHKGHHLFGTVLNHQAYLRLAQKDFGGAASLFKRALKIERKQWGDDHPSIASALDNLGLIRHVMGDLREATRLHEKAVKLRRVGGEAGEGLVTSLRNLGDVLVAVRREAEAFERLDEAERINDRLISEIFRVGTEAQRLSYLEKLRSGFDSYLTLVTQSFAESPPHIRAALDMVLARKGIAAEAIALQRQAVLRGDHSDLVPELEELSRLRMEIAQMELEGIGSSSPGSHELQLGRLEERKEALEADLAAAIPRDLGQRLREANREAVASALPVGSALIEFVRFEVFDFHAVPARGEAQWKPARYVAFVIRASEPEDAAMLDLGEAEVIDRLVGDLRASIAPDEEARGVSDRRTSIAGGDVGLRLRRAVFDPLLAHLAGRQRLFLSSDGDLTRLPFEVLPLNDGGRLIDTFSVSYVSAGRDVLRFGAATAEPPTEPVVAADPDFDLGGPVVTPAHQAVGASTGSAPEAAEETESSRELDRAGLSFGRLFGTRGEGEAIAKRLNVRPWTEAQVLESRIKDCRSPWILHLATHGFFLQDQGRGEGGLSGLAVDGEEMWGAGLENPLLRSGLALAGANTFLRGGALPAEAEDGILTAEDVSCIDLRGTELVVLSACETALGDVHIGEGVFGLRRAFVLAGARSLVMSLWNVPDQPTRELMERFYALVLAGESRNEALRAAQLELRTRYPHPWFWGAFICQGDPGPLEGGSVATNTDAFE